MAIEEVKEYFRQFGITNRIMEFEGSSATVELAAAALNCQPARIAKTLSFIVNDQPILIVAAGDTKIDNSKYKPGSDQSQDALPRPGRGSVGHAVGGVCPFAVNDGVTVFLDESLKRFQTVFPSLRQQQQRRGADPSRSWSDTPTSPHGLTSVSWYRLDPVLAPCIKHRIEDTFLQSVSHAVFGVL